MNLRPRRREDPELNLIPMIDVVLVLLIFFMIATSLRHESELEINLPEASGSPMPGDVAPLEVSIDAQGRYSIHGVQGQLLDSTAGGEALREALRQASRGQSLPLIISADGRTPHQAVVTVLDIAGQLGLRRVAIATRNAPEKTPSPLSLESLSSPPDL
ncbi:MAG: biopolymer transporter ExbD [Candidatus Competibacteraceae bacterium]|nr:biopolymer transporter ExbD [Candidatus Competibacteraceae bacterium]HRY15182.1 biopolymer transporter ExbD [Candidatus Competibacteraceae bacterium]